MRQIVVVTDTLNIRKATPETAATKVTDAVQARANEGWTLRSSFVDEATVFLVFQKKVKA